MEVSISKEAKGLRSRLNRLYKTSCLQLESAGIASETCIHIFNGVLYAVGKSIWHIEINDLEQYFNHLNSIADEDKKNAIKELRSLLKNIIKRFEKRTNRKKIRLKKFQYGELKTNLELVISREGWKKEQTVRSTKIERVLKYFLKIGYKTTHGSIRAKLRDMGYSVTREK